MKTIFTILCLLLPMSALAESYISVSRTNGESRSSCIVRGERLVLNVTNKGEFFSKTMYYDVVPGALEQAIRGARTEPVSIALHIMAAIPAIEMVVGENDNERLLIFSDGGRMETRQGENSDVIRAFINQTCEATYFELITESPAAKL